MPFKKYLKFSEVISQSHDCGFAHLTVKPRSWLLAANQLRKETMIFQVFKQNDNKVKEVNIVQIKIKGKNRLYIFIEAVLCPKICSPITNQRYNFARNNYDHLRNIKLLKHSEGDLTSIDLLIGNDFYYLFINGNIVKGQKDEPIAIETYLGGFILSGVFINKNINKESSINFNSTHVSI